MIKVKYLDKRITKLEKTEKGDLIDLRVSWVKVNDIKYTSEDFNINKEESNDTAALYFKGDIVKIGFGVAMELPEGYKGCILPRSSTFTNYGLILTNSEGQVDNSYKGDNDEWCGMFYALKDGCIGFDERVAQFDIQKTYIKDHELQEVETLGNSNRGGYGTTGVK